MIVAEIKGRTKVHKEVRCSAWLHSHSHKTQGFYKSVFFDVVLCGRLNVLLVQFILSHTLKDINIVESGFILQIR